ncbi:SCP-related protein precursor [Bombyx mori]|uniref:SCP-related protein n=1 Tax=Bombyx mori TaxID=7091 RepID=Q152R4_BOMMO|nr:SCP-related protein precursor [Bombyx mori]ABG25817.1 SCP-related protein [Bombyx mori]
MQSFLIFVVALACFQSIDCRKLQPLSCDDIRQFVNGHNLRREQIAKGEISGQPAATQMKYMIWDKELAAKAAKWASSDNDFHNPDRSIASERFSTGENLYWYMTSNKNHKINPDSALESWFNEHENYKFAPLKSSDFQKTGKKQIAHYTQMVWSDSDRVGCAIGTSRTAQMKSFFVVCNYGPAGNYLGNIPYKSGEPSNRLVCGAGDCSKPYGDQC